MFVLFHPDLKKFQQEFELLTKSVNSIDSSRLNALKEKAYASMQVRKDIIEEDAKLLDSFMNIIDSDFAKKIKYIFQHENFNSI